jgi:uncharacterized protein
VRIAFILAAMAVGVLTGTVTSLIGGSAVMIVVPVLIMAFGMNAHVAIGTSLFVDVITSLTVAASYHKHGNINLKPGLWIAGMSVLGAQLGAQLASLMPDNSLSSGFGVLTAFVGLTMLIKTRTGGKGLSLDYFRRKIHLDSARDRALVCGPIGFVIGIISGVFGAGGGILILIVLSALLSFPMHAAVGTSTLIMAITALSSAIGYTVRGFIDFPMGIILTAGSVPGALLGARFANKVDERVLRYFVSGVLVTIGVVMFILKGK